MFTCNVIFGSDQGLSGKAIEYEFNTQGELNAFIDGMNAAVGWLEFEVLEDRDEFMGQRAGYCVGGVSVCSECLTDREDPDNQTAYLAGESYDCSRCDGFYIQP